MIGASLVWTLVFFYWFLIPWRQLCYDLRTHHQAQQLNEEGMRFCKTHLVLSKESFRWAALCFSCFFPWVFPFLACWCWLSKSGLESYNGLFFQSYTCLDLIFVVCKLQGGAKSEHVYWKLLAEAFGHLLQDIRRQRFVVAIFFRFASALSFFLTIVWGFR